MAKALSYDELMAYALKHYDRGGDSMYECWDVRDFDEYVKECGPITKSEALRLFRINYEYEREARGRWQ